MASVSYLWANRAKPEFGSAAFFRAWAKRILLFRILYIGNRRRAKLLRKGAKISDLAEVSLLNIQGSTGNLEVGAFSFIGRVYLMLHDKVEIGERVCINDGVEIITASHDVTDPKWQQFSKKVVIEDYVWIGMGAMILPGVTLGKGCVVGARAVVSKSVAPGVVVTGNPAAPVSKTRSKTLDYNPCEFLAANRSWLIG